MPEAHGEEVRPVVEEERLLTDAQQTRHHREQRLKRRQQTVAMAANSTRFYATTLNHNGVFTLAQCAVLSRKLTSKGAHKEYGV